MRRAAAALRSLAGRSEVLRGLRAGTCAGVPFGAATRGQAAALCALLFAGMLAAVLAELAVNPGGAI